VWTWTAFVLLRRLAKIVTDKRIANNKPLMGSAETLGVFADFARGRIERQGRNRMILLTLCLIGLTLALPVLL